MYLDGTPLLVALWRYETRRPLFCSLYRNILKDLNRHPILSKDAITAGHVRIKSRYIVQRTRREHELSELASRYKMLWQVYSKLNTQAEDLICEAYGLRQEDDINAGLFVDEFDREKFTPRDIQTIFLRANREHCNDQGEKFVDFKTLMVEPPAKITKSLNQMLSLTSPDSELF